MKVSYLLLAFTILIAGIACEPAPKSKQDTLNELLADLSKASMQELESQNVMFDGVSVPIYTTDGEQIKGMKIMQLLMTGEYVPDAYMDESKQIKVFVLRTATAAERKELADMQSGMREGSDLLGKDALPFSVSDIKDKEYSLEALKGKVIVMNFWFIHCKPCVMEMPDLNELVEKYKGKDVVFLGFSPDKKKQLEAFLKKKEFHYNILPSSEPTINQYEIEAFPTHLVIDKESKISFSAVGLGPTTIDDLAASIDESLAK